MPESGIKFVKNDTNSISVIIPAFNEEEHIGSALNALKKFLRGRDYEIIVVDNGSTDDTHKIVRSFDVTLIEFPVGTISAVRNKGVENSRGNILVFIDADVHITKEWAEQISLLGDTLQENPMLVTGARLLPPNDNEWLNRYWFSLLVTYEATYINSGNLVTSRILFDKIGGFSEKLVTAEDYDFCKRAKLSGACIDNNNRMVAFHMGYPQSIAEFIKRERWHGRQDFETFSSFRESKMAWAATFNFLLLVSSALVSLVSFNFLWILLYGLVMYMVSVGLTIYKFKIYNFTSVSRGSVIFYFYLVGRSAALFDRLVSLTVSARKEV